MKNSSSKLASKTLTIVGSVLCIIFGFLLLCNLTIIIQGTLNPDRPPSIFKTTPLIVMSGSMSGSKEGHIEVGDLIFVKSIDTSTLVVGDVIAYDDGKNIITHRIVEKNGEELITKGDANNVEDPKPVLLNQVIGKYTYRIAKLGNVALFLQTPMGMLIFIGIPFIAFIFYDILQNKKSRQKRIDENAALKQELERLRKITEEKKD